MSADIDQRLTLWAAKQPREEGAKLALEAVDEIVRLRGALRRLAEQDATLSVCNGNVTVDMDATLTAAERKAIESCICDDIAATAYDRADILRGLLERLGGKECTA